MKNIDLQYLNACSLFLTKEGKTVRIEVEGVSFREIATPN